MSTILLMVGGIVVSAIWLAVLLFMWALCRAAGQPTPTPFDNEARDTLVRSEDEVTV